MVDEIIRWEVREPEGMDSDDRESCDSDSKQESDGTDETSKFLFHYYQKKIASGTDSECLSSSGAF